MPRRGKLPIEQRVSLEDPSTFVVCKICKGIFENLTQHINRKHNTTGKEYLEKYGGSLRSEVAAKTHSDSMKKFLSTDEGRALWKVVQDKHIITMTEKEKKEKYGFSGKNHPLWGVHQSEDSKRRNSINNKIASAKLKNRLIVEGGWENFVERRVHRGSSNGMFGKTPPKGAGRCKYFDYVSTVSGKTFLLQGSFEVRMAKIFDKLKCCWEKTKDRFGYTYNGVDRSYNPDFKVIRSKGRVFYYETKGYINEEAVVKFEAVRALKLNFIVVDKERLEQYERHFGIR